MISLPKIPKFKSVDEEATFWDTHDFTDYLGDTEPVDEPVELDASLKSELSRRRAARRRKIAIALQPDQLHRLERLAKAKGLSAEDLLCRWVEEALAKETATGA